MALRNELEPKKNLRVRVFVLYLTVVYNATLLYYQGRTSGMPDVCTHTCMMYVCICMCNRINGKQTHTHTEQDTYIHWFTTAGCITGEK